MQARILALSPSCPAGLCCRAITLAWWWSWLLCSDFPLVQCCPRQWCACHTACTSANDAGRHESGSCKCSRSLMPGWCWAGSAICRFRCCETTSLDGGEAGEGARLAGGLGLRRAAQESRQKDMHVDPVDGRRCRPSGCWVFHYHSVSRCCCRAGRLRPSAIPSSQLTAPNTHPTPCSCAQCRAAWLLFAELVNSAHTGPGGSWGAPFIDFQQVLLTVCCVAINSPILPQLSSGACAALRGADCAPHCDCPPCGAHLVERVSRSSGAYSAHARWVGWAVRKLSRG